MSSMELEVKVLEIDQEELEKKILNLGGKLKCTEEQYVYTYDLPTVYGRFADILFQLNKPENQVKFEISIEKLKFLSYEVKKLLSSDQKEKLKNIIGYENLADVLEKENFLDLLNKEELKEFLGELGLNPNKWIRIRTSNEKTTLTVKHILESDSETFLQPLKEIEIEVSSMKEANEFMEAIGFAHKCYLEKRRTTYSLADHLIEVDTWPKIPTYFELEGKNEEDIENVLNLLGYSIKDKNVVSCIVDEIYEMYGFPKTSNFKELKF